MVIESEPTDHFVAKEPMSITAVGVYDIDQQEFWTSHFWNKLEHMLIVYYHYAANHAVTPFEYRTFPIKGFEFHSFAEEEIQALKADWEHVRDLAARVIAHHSGPRNKEWKEAVKYLIAFLIVIENGPKMSFEQDTMQVRTNVDQLCYMDEYEALNEMMLGIYANIISIK